MTGEAFTACLRAGTEGQSAASVHAGTFKDSKPGRAERYRKARPGRGRPARSWLSISGSWARSSPP